MITGKDEDRNRHEEKRGDEEEEEEAKNAELEEI